MNNIITLTQSEKNSIYKSIGFINKNPYESFDEFYNEIKIIKGLPNRFNKFCLKIKTENFYFSPYFLIKNSPIDKYVPFLDYENPVLDKRIKKKTFISEGFLLLVSYLIGKPPISYLSLNDGDIFQDVHPFKKKSHDQSQKSIGNIYFHRDFMNRPVAPDYLLLLGLRHIDNIRVLTNISPTYKVIESLSKETISNLKKNKYITPPGNPGIVKNNNIELHSVIHEESGIFEIKFSEKNTYTDNKHNKFLKNLKDAIHDNKIGIEVKSGNFLIMTNIYAVHNREILNDAKESELKNRWIMKTANIDNISSIKEHTVEWSDHIIKG